MARVIISQPRDFISLINDLREERDFSYRDFGAASGLAHATLANAVSRGDVKLSTALAYMQALGLRMEIVRERRQ